MCKFDANLISSIIDAVNKKNIKGQATTSDSQTRDRESESGGNQCREVRGYCKQVHRFKGADSRSASHIHRANHYPRKNGKAQQICLTADRHLLPLYRKADTRRSRLTPQNETGRTVETVRPAYREHLYAVNILMRNCVISAFLFICSFWLLQPLLLCRGRLLLRRGGRLR